MIKDVKGYLCFVKTGRTRNCDKILKKINPKKKKLNLKKLKKAYVDINYNLFTILRTHIILYHDNLSL